MQQTQPKTLQPAPAALPVQPAGLVNSGAMAIPFRLVLLAPLLLVAACASTPDYPPAGYGQYRVQPGDTLYRIARVHNQTVANLARWNRISVTSDIQAG